MYTHTNGCVATNSPINHPIMQLPRFFLFTTSAKFFINLLHTSLGGFVPQQPSLIRGEFHGLPGVVPSSTLVVQKLGSLVA